MQISTDASGVLFQDYGTTPGAYRKQIFGQQSSTKDATTILGCLQFTSGPTKAHDSEPTAEAGEPDQIWFDYLLARHRAAFR